MRYTLRKEKMNYVAFVYEPRDNVYTFISWYNSEKEAVSCSSKFNDDVYIVIYKRCDTYYISNGNDDEDDNMLPYRKCIHTSTIKGKNTLSYLSCVPMNYAIEITTTNWVFSCT